METLISITQWIKRFDSGLYDSSDADTQISAGWYDWFCDDSSLRNKTYKMATKIKKLAKILGQKFCDTHYVWFKNNCPLTSPLYDDFRFANMLTGDVIFTVTPNRILRKYRTYGRVEQDSKSELWGRENEFASSLVEGEWKDVVDFIKNKSKYTQELR